MKYSDELFSQVSVILTVFDDQDTNLSIAHSFIEAYSLCRSLFQSYYPDNI